MIIQLHMKEHLLAII